MGNTSFMRYGFYLPTRGPSATREGVLSLAREGERLGLHSAMIADHVVFPIKSESDYPYTLDRKHPGGGDALETFSILGIVAGATEKLRLVTSVLVLPYRNPVLTAKMVASLDVLSDGRVTLGVGVGWLKEEFEALASPDFAQRGAVTDEWIAIFKQLWSESQRLSKANSTITATSAASPSHCRNHIRRSGSAAIRRPHCAVPRAMATAGIRSARSQPRRCRRTRCANTSKHLDVCVTPRSAISRPCTFPTKRPFTTPACPTAATTGAASPARRRRLPTTFAHLPISAYTN